MNMNTMPANLSHWLVVSQYRWGKGETRGEALANLRRQGQVGRRGKLIVYRVSPEVVIDQHGRFVYTHHSDDQEYQRQVEEIN